MPWPSEKPSATRLKNVKRSRKWLMCLFPSLRRRRRGSERCGGSGWRPPLDVVEQSAAPRVIAPGDEHAGHVEDEEAPQRHFHSAGQVDRRAVEFWDEEGAECGDRRRESGDGGGFLF